MTQPSRRQFLSTAGLLGAGALVAASTSPAWAADTTVSATSQAQIDAAFASNRTTYSQPVLFSFYQAFSAGDGFAQDVYINIDNYDAKDIPDRLAFQIVIKKVDGFATHQQRLITRALSSFGTVPFQTRDHEIGEDTYQWNLRGPLLGTDHNNRADAVIGFGGGITTVGRIKNALVITPLNYGAPALADIVGSDAAQDSGVQAYYRQALAAWSAAGYGYKYAYRNQYNGTIVPVSFGQAIDSRDAGNDCPSVLQYDFNGIF